MKIWTLSDLHQEFVPEQPREMTFDPAAVAPDDFDLVVLAGDVNVPLAEALRWAASRFSGVPLVYVPGNHDYYAWEGDPRTMDEILSDGREEAARLGIHLLSDDVLELEGTRIVGATLWTDFMVGYGSTAGKINRAAGRNGMSDYRRMKRWSTATPGKRKRARPIDTIERHKRSRAFIERTLATPFDGSTVVVTHHAPSIRSLLNSGRDDLDWCYASPLESIMEGPGAPETWIHGHIHRRQDYVVGGTRVVANPHGYRWVASEKANGFEPSLVVDVGTPAPKPPGMGA